jgi:hypothetical protein
MTDELRRIVAVLIVVAIFVGIALGAWAWGAIS